MARLLGIGDNTVDIYVDQGVQFPGGNAVNVAVLAARLGARASYIGCVGRDHFGTLVRNALETENVDISHLRVIDAPNSWSRIRHIGNDRVFDGSRPSLRGAYALTAGDFSYIARHDIVHSSIYSKIEDDLNAISAAAPCMSFDYSSEYNTSYIRDTAPSLKIAFLSDADSSESACRSLCRDVSALGPETVVITRGRKGAIGYHCGAFHDQSVLDGPVVDTLGAGDGFIAAFLLAVWSGQPLSVALQRGAESALRVCAECGAFGHGSPIRPGQPGLTHPGPNSDHKQRPTRCNNHA
ncbi:PfkB family carbohydrate kinase [uncultured Hoeflea sp.]|uniref:PfkB family carbohydrate kinase n=1 Tax=uncultured Hoeflea sp. TaxID=538666 RepID=UPI00261281FC|nr:PfkB family carbohydrate kinase [uncultured Hoeflea sp.]